MTTRIPQDQYTGHPGQWAYLEFQAWADKAERTGHFKARQAPHIVRMFNESLHTPNPKASLKTKLKDCVRRGYITEGNRKAIKQKASEILHCKSKMGASQPAAAPSAAPQATSSHLSDDLIYKISEKDLKKIRKDAPKVYRFLTDRTFKPDPDRDYDLGIEEEYGVLWIEPDRDSKDRRFIDLLRQKYASDFDRIERQIFDKRNRFRPDQSTRLANNNIASLFSDAQKDPIIRDVLREALAYLLSK